GRRGGFGGLAFRFVHAAPDGGTARAEGTAFLGGTYNQGFRAMLDRVAVTGTPDEVARRLQAFLDAGARHLVFTPATRGDAEPIRRRLLDEVLPTLTVTEAASPPR